MNEPIEAIVSDLDGVVYRGELPVPGAVEAIRAWSRKSLPYVFVTNNATKSAFAVAEKLARLGIPAEAGQVVTAAETTGSYLGTHFRKGVRTFAIGEKVIFDALSREGAGLADSDDVEVVVLGFDYALDYGKIRTAVRAVLNGAALVVTNPDILTPANTGYEPCVGAILAVITTAAPDVRPIVIGKPSAMMIEEALRRLGTARRATIMVGDQVATDIVAGQAAGLRSYLVSTGVPQTQRQDVQPHAIIDSLLDLPV